MKKITITLVFILASLIGFSQNKTAKGRVLDINDKSAIQNAVIKINDTSIYTYTNELGQFSIEIPKSFKKISVHHDDYLTKDITLKPGFQQRPLNLYLQSKNYNELVKNEEKIKDSIYKVHKNTLSLSVLELFTVAIAGCYEHAFLDKHSLGTYLSIYVYGRNMSALGSEYDYYPVYQGFKLAPFYRYYPFNNNRKLFVEGKIQVGYFNFSRLEYRLSSHSTYEKDIHYSFWTGGFGASAGVKLPAKKVKITLVAGYQYFPINVPESIEVEMSDGTMVSLETDTYWWYRGGPGTPFVFKFLIGGAF